MEVGYQSQGGVREGGSAWVLGAGWSGWARMGGVVLEPDALGEWWDGWN